MLILLVQLCSHMFIKIYGKKINHLVYNHLVHNYADCGREVMYRTGPSASGTQCIKDSTKKKCCNWAQQSTLKGKASLPLCAYGGANPAL